MKIQINRPLISVWLSLFLPCACHGATNICYYVAGVNTYSHGDGEDLGLYKLSFHHIVPATNLVSINQMLSEMDGCDKSKPAVYSPEIGSVIGVNENRAVVLFISAGVDDVIYEYRGQYFLRNGMLYGAYGEEHNTNAYACPSLNRKIKSIISEETNTRGGEHKL